MKLLLFRLGLLAWLAVFAAMLSKPAIAQVTADGSLSTRITSPDNRNFTIDDGDRAGNNLFHSFRDFSIPTGGSAYFNNAADVQNIFSRVTGGNVSNIDGLIRANGSANLFLLNPNGIIFGPNATLNIGGSFTASTANKLLFNDGVILSTSNTSTPILTVSAPIGLQLGTNAGSIQIQEIPSPTAPSGLRVATGQTLAFVGGQIDMTGATLNAPDGQIELWATQNAQVNLANQANWQFVRLATPPNWGTISLTQGSSIDAGGIDGGAIHIQGRGFTLTDSNISSSTSAGQGRGIAIQTTDFVTLDTRAAAAQFNALGLSTSVGNQFSFVTGFIPSSTTGRAGDITISTNRLQITHGAWIQSTTSGSNSRTGDILLNANHVEMFGSQLVVPSIGTLITAGNNNESGRVAIQSEQVSLLDGGRISSSVLGGNGRAGEVAIQATDSLAIQGANFVGVTSAVLASLESGTTGEGGRVAIETGRLLISNGGGITSEIVGSTTGGAPGTPFLPKPGAQGNAGNITINADEIRLSEPLFDTYSQSITGIKSSVGGGAVGSGGAINLRANRLYVLNGGQLTSSNNGQGVAGNVNLQVGSILVDGISPTLINGQLLPSTIAASSSTAFDAGSVNIRATRLQIRNQGEIATRAIGSGNAGRLTFDIDTLDLDRGQIAIENTGTGNAGNLTVQANRVDLNNRSVINASTRTGHSGDITFNVSDRLQLNQQSQILAETQQRGRGGNISLSVPEIELAHNSNISTNAGGTATGGRLNISSDRLSLLGGSQITASTAGTGRAGSLNIHANDGITLTGRNTRLAAASTTNATAGSITLQTPHLQVGDRAAISVNGQGQGGAGDLTVQANRIGLDHRARLEAEVAGGDRGNITLNADLLSLQNASQITTNATGTASGGNITLNTDFVVGLENSDIVARAQQGSGGNIAIATQGLIGIAPSPALTAESDINASSQVGLNGTVNVTTPNVDPRSGLIELPTEVVDSSQQIAATCAATQNSQFIATGRGGIPDNPTQTVGSDRLWVDLRDLSAGFAQSGGPIAATASASAFAAPSTAIVEATAFHINPNGQLELVAEHANAGLPRSIATCGG